MLFVYLHGFLSGPNAVKAGILRTFLKSYPQHDIEVPAYPDDPVAASAYLESFIRERLDKNMILVGSSMGGFMATVLQSRFKLPAVLINPCVHPQDYFQKLTGTLHNDYSGEDFVPKPSMLDFLKKLDLEAKNFIPEKTKVFLQTGDEVLDYRKAVYFYAGAHIHIAEGGCHAYGNFEKICPEILKFASLWDKNTVYAIDFITI